MESKTMGIGVLITLAIAIIVGAIILQASAQNIDEVVNTVSVANESMGVAVNGTVVYLDYQSLSDVVIYNSTSSVVTASEYTVTNKVVNNGALTVSIEPASPAGSNVTGYEWFVSGTAEPTGYGDSAGRAMANLVIIMMALALVVVVVGAAVKNGNFM